MGIISVAQQDELFWLGRYTERVYTTLRIYARYSDSMIEQGDLYILFCQSMEIQNIYTSPEDFLKSYGYNEDNPDSLISNLLRAYDNAVILREVIGSDSLSYIQMAVYAIRRAAVSKSPILELQKVCDNILAFWGISDDRISLPQARDLIKTGRRLERLDLYARMHYNRSELQEAVRRLTSYRLVRSGLHFSEKRVTALEDDMRKDPIDYQDMVTQVENIFD